MGKTKKRRIATSDSDAQARKNSPAHVIENLCNQLRGEKSSVDIAPESVDDMIRKAARDAAHVLQVIMLLVVINRIITFSPPPSHSSYSISMYLQATINELQHAIDVASALVTDHHTPLVTTPDLAKELIAYAHRLSFTTTAPPGFIPGQTPLMLFKPPAPQDIQLRSSALHQFQRTCYCCYCYLCIYTRPLINTHIYTRRRL